jgi:hypothetical protein
MATRKYHFVVGGCAVVAAGAFLIAGPLNPPTGPVSAGGKTTQEIYDAVTNVGGSIGAVGGRGPAVPGASRTQGTFSVTAPNSNSFSGPILGLRLAVRTPTSGGLPSGQTVVDGCTIVRELSDGSAKAFRLIGTNGAITTATAVVPSASGNTTYVFTAARVFGVRHFNIQRSDGTFAAMEELDLSFQSVAVTDAGGTSYTFSLVQP